MKLWLLFLLLHFADGIEDSDVISEADVLAFEKSLEREARSSNMRPTETTDADEQDNVRNSRETSVNEASSEITGTSRHHKKKKTVRRRVTKQVSHRIRGRPRHRFGSSNTRKKSFRKQFETSAGQLLPSRRQSLFIRPESGLRRPLTQTSLTQSITVNQLNKLPTRPIAALSQATRRPTSFHRSASGFIRRKTSFGGTASLDNRLAVPQSVQITPITSTRTNNRLLLHVNSMVRRPLNLLPPPLPPVFPLPSPSRSRTSHRVLVPTRVEPRLFRPQNAGPQPLQLKPPSEARFIPKWKTNQFNNRRLIPSFNTDARPTPRVEISTPQLEKGLDEALLLEAERNIEQAVLEAVEENQVRNRPQHTHSGSALRQIASSAPRRKINSRRFNRLRGQILSSTASIDDTPISTTPLTATTEEVTDPPSTVPSRPMNSNENKSKEEVMHKKNLQSGTSSERFSTGQIRSEKRPHSRRRMKLLRPPVFHSVENVTESAFILTEVSNEHEIEVQKNIESTLGTTETSTTTTTEPRTRSTTPRTTTETTTEVTAELSTSTTEQTTTTVTRTTPETTVSVSTTTTTTSLPTTTVSETTTTPTTSTTTTTPLPSTTVETTTIHITTTTEIPISTSDTSTTLQPTTSTTFHIVTTAEDNLASIDDFAVISDDLTNITDSTAAVSSSATTAVPTSILTTLAPPPRTPPRAQVPSVDRSAERISDEIERNLIEGNQGPVPPVENSTNTVDFGPRRGPPGMVPPGVRLPETGPPGAAPPSDTIVNQLNQADDFMEVARQLRIVRRKKTVARRKRAAERDRFIFNLRRSRSL